MTKASEDLIATIEKSSDKDEIIKLARLTYEIEIVRAAANRLYDLFTRGQGRCPHCGIFPLKHAHAYNPMKQAAYLVCESCGHRLA